MKISLLGDLMIVGDNGRPIDLEEQGGRRKRRVRNLISILALRDWALTSGQLKELLWDDPLDRDYTSTLTNLIYQSRRILPPDRLVSEQESGSPWRYRMALNPGDEVDSRRFTELAGLGEQARREADLDQAAGLFGQALRLWRARPGRPLLPDLPDRLSMQRPLRSLLALRVRLAEDWAEIQLERGAHGRDLADEIQALIDLDPTNERLRSLRMLCLYRSDRKNEALHAYTEAVGILEDILDALPGPALERMHRRIRYSDPELSWKPLYRAPSSARIPAPDRPTVNGVDDVILGGKDNYEPDRSLVQEIISETGTDSWKLLEEKTLCAQRMTRYLAGQGIRQFVDFGSGPPQQMGRLPLHVIARRYDSGCRFIYSDTDPVVAAHFNSYMTDGEGVIFRELDLMDVRKCLHEAREHLDFNEPVAFMFFNVLQYVGATTEDLGTNALRRTMQLYVDALPSGSYLGIIHLSGDQLDPLVRPYIDALNPDAPLPNHLRTPEQISELFCGLPLIPPGLTDVADWRPEEPFTPRRMRILGGIARKPDSARIPPPST
ncbi:SAM-dependent methyltransferase [Spirillospora sp. CA-294931]|uniref:SAM-dependent methyltransferase n=1 Tax=Spirillospora sp. CA-294931 TaxID=3240042 RepID=UPI003D8BC13F